ncbi:MAG: hypothetical protein ACD_7C00439G0001 [uncultured bacterium]|nr:MAG: hypothetical protein ACD_7C00439G0001 [uncultured bacterium]
MEEIREAYGRFLIDEDTYSIDYIIETCQKAQDVYLNELQNDTPNKDDLLDDLRVFFQEEEDKKTEETDDFEEEIKIPPRNSFFQSERNQSCFCGSGKKFKECCKKKSSYLQSLSPYLPPISFEPIWDDADDIDPKDAQVMLKILKENNPGENSETVLPILLELKEKYPHIPELYCLIDFNYFSSGKTKESIEMMHACFRKFPNDLFWKIKYAEYLLRRGEYDKIGKLFNDKFTLQELYPEKPSFYIVDFERFSCFMVLYFATIGQIKKADLYLKALKEFTSRKDFVEQLDQFIEESYQKQYLKNQLTVSKIH